MSNIIDSYNKIKSNILKIDSNNRSKIIAVSKTFALSHIMPLINYGHDHFE